MDIIATKIIVAILFGLIRFLFGICPIKIYGWLKTGRDDQGNNVINEKRQEKLEFGIAIVQAFGGGVLFATSFLHMMPEVYFEVEELKSYGVLGDDYPYSQLIVSLGFFTIYFTEEVSQWLISRAPKEPCWKRAESRIWSSATTMTTTSRIYPQINKIPSGMAFEIEKKPKEEFFYDNTDIMNEKNEKYFEDLEVVADNVDEGCQTENIRNLENVQAIESNLDLDMDVNAEIEEIIQEEVKSKQQVLRYGLVVLALSFHAIFEGLAIGLQRSVTNIWYLFTAVAIHSATILFCIGLEVVLSGAKPRTTMIHMSMLSGTSPFGVLLGLIITLTTNLHTSAKSFAIVLLEGLSSGTILYITFFETLSREKERRQWRAVRAIFIGAGFALMAVLECFKLGT